MDLLTLPLLLGAVDLDLDLVTNTYSEVTSIDIAAASHDVWDHTFQIRNITPDELLFSIFHNLLRTPRLTLTTTYRTRGPINWYMHWWGHRFLSDFHTAVLSVIKHRAETQRPFS